MYLRSEMTGARKASVESQTIHAYRLVRIPWFCVVCNAFAFICCFVSRSRCKLRWICMSRTCDVKVPRVQGRNVVRQQKVYNCTNRNI